MLTFGFGSSHVLLYGTAVVPQEKHVGSRDRCATFSRLDSQEGRTALYIWAAYIAPRLYVGK